MEQIITRDNRVRQYLDREISAAVNQALGYSFRVSEQQKQLAETLNQLNILRAARRALGRGERLSMILVNTVFRKKYFMPPDAFSGARC